MPQTAGKISIFFIADYDYLIQTPPQEMKIGIDAKWYFSGPISGRLLLQNVLPEMIDSHPEIEWHIFLKVSEKNLDFPLKKNNVHTHYINGVPNLLSNLFVLPKHAKKLGLDAVLFQTFSPRGKGFKSIVFVHDVLFRNYPQYFTWKERIYFWPLRWTIPNADKIITTTEFVKNELIRFGYAKDEKQISLAPSGVTNIFKPLELQNKELLKKVKEKFDLPDVYLLFVGRLNARKNIENLIKSLPLLKDKRIPLVIVGEESWKLPRLKKLLGDPEVRSRIQFTGAVSNEELACIYSMATIFCFPSFAEGFGLPPLEAMASGVPALVSNTTSIPEVCGIGAIFIDPNNPKSIVKKIDELLTDHILYNEKVTNGLEWSKNYTWKNTADKIVNSILNVASNNQ